MNDKTKSSKKLSSIIPVISIIAFSLILITSGLFLLSAQGQTRNCSNLESKNALPVLLIHGWNEGLGGSLPIHFDVWQEQLNQDEIPFCIVSFERSNDASYDACGSAADHAKELVQIVQNIINETGQSEVNIVGFSKGGLDARVYLANDLANDNVANLIMVGTPNAGSSLAIGTDECSPGILDIRPQAPATRVRENTHTTYYTIAGACFLIGDGLVSTSSVNSQPYFKSLGTSNSCHPDLLGAYEYELTHDVLIGRQ